MDPGEEQDAGSEQHWVVGYGSLMHPDSVARTLGRRPHGLAVWVPDWQRDFRLAIVNPGRYRCRRCRGAVRGVAAADAQPRRGSGMGAVAWAVHAAELQLLDRREQSYRRVQLPRTRPELQGRAWIYQGLPRRRDRARVMPTGYWQLLTQGARLAGWPSPPSPSLPRRDLEPVGMRPRQPCRCQGRG